jgi:hypothetical protein
MSQISRVDAGNKKAAPRRRAAFEIQLSFGKGLLDEQIWICCDGGSSGKGKANNIEQYGNNPEDS